MCISIEEHLLESVFTFSHFELMMSWINFFRRRPAWCDRILYRVNKSNNYENVNLDIQQVNISQVK
jgi:hypothetical protein